MGPFLAQDSRRNPRLTTTTIATTTISSLVWICQRGSGLIDRSNQVLITCKHGPFTMSNLAALNSRRDIMHEMHDYFEMCMLCRSDGSSPPGWKQQQFSGPTACVTLGLSRSGSPLLRSVESAWSRDKPPRCGGCRNRFMTHQQPHLPSFGNHVCSF